MPVIRDIAHVVGIIYLLISLCFPGAAHFAVSRELTKYDYTVGWVCAIPIEMAAVLAILDERHPKLSMTATDTNIYSYGQVGEHNVVIACLPPGRYGTVSAATVAAQMRSAFPTLRFGLMVGIGGGVPSASKDIRLGDVVVSQPASDSGGVIQYDFGKTIEKGNLSVLVH